MNRNNAPATFVLLAAYLIVFFRFDLIDPNDSKLIAAGASCTSLIVAGDWWRMLSSQVVHIGLIHLLMNAYFLFMVGPTLEAALGTPRFVILYVIGGLCGDVAICLVYDPQIISAGGSTSLFAMLGAFVAMHYRAGRSVRDFFDSPAARSLLGLILANLIIGWIVPYISQTGHIGGLVGGLLLVSIAFRMPEAGGPPRHRPLRERIVLVVFLVAATALALRPVHRQWFLARQLWFAQQDDRADALAKGLIASGVEVPLTRYLRFAGRASRNTRDPLTTLERDVLLSTYDGNALYDLGMDYTQLKRTETVLKELGEGKQDAIERLPRDPWYRLPRP